MKNKYDVIYYIMYFKYIFEFFYTFKIFWIRRAVKKVKCQTFEYRGSILFWIESFTILLLLPSRIHVFTNHNLVTCRSTKTILTHTFDKDNTYTYAPQLNNNISLVIYDLFGRQEFCKNFKNKPKRRVHKNWIQTCSGCTVPMSCLDPPSL
jgi:hypothetical protein